MIDIATAFYGVPEYFIDAVQTEDAGNGNMRLLVYGKRGGALVPLYSVVLAAINLIEISQQLTEAAMASIYKVEMRAGATAH